jgi:hypothetical protein
MMAEMSMFILFVASASALCCFWLELAPVMYDGMLGNQQQAQQIVQLVHCLFRKLMSYQIRLDSLRQIDEDIVFLHGLLLRDFGPEVFDCTFHMLLHVTRFMHRHGPWPCTWNFAPERKNHSFIMMHTNGTKIEWQFGMEVSFCCIILEPGGCGQRKNVERLEDMHSFTKS